MDSDRGVQDLSSRSHNSPKPDQESRLVGVPKEHVDLLWPQVVGMVGDVCKLTNGRHEPEDIREFLLKGICQLWLSWRGGVEAIAVTEIVCYPRLKAARIFQLCGKDREHWLGFERLIATWAKSEGCARMEVIGRKGWVRVLKNYQEQAIVLERAI